MSANALGSLLLQPQALQRAQTITDDKALLDELLALLQQIMLNPAQAEALAPAFKAAVSEHLAQQLAQLGPRMNAALAEVSSMVQPLINQVNTLVAQAGDLHTVGQVAELIGSVLDGLLGLVQSLTQAQVAELVTRVTHLLSTTLGLSQTLLHDQLRALFTGMRSHLLAGTGVMSEQGAATRHACVALIGRVERELLPQLPVVPFDSNRIAQLLMQALRDLGLDKFRAQAQSLLDKMRAALGAATTLIDLVKPSVFGPGSGGAAEVRPPLSGDTYCWYATWLFANKNDDPKGGEVWLSADGTQLILRQSLTDSIVLHEDPAGNLQWFDAPMFKNSSGPMCYTFKHIEPGTMEAWAQILWCVATFGKSVAHVVDMATSPREYASNIPMAVWHTSNMFSGFFAKAPLPSYLVAAAGWGQSGQWLYKLIYGGAVLGGSFEGIHTKAGGWSILKQWLSLLLGDVMNDYSYSSLPGTAVDVVLSMLTLINYDGPGTAPDGPDLRARNLDTATNFASLGSFGAVYLLYKLAPRQHYGLPWPMSDSGWPWLWWTSATAAAIVGDLLGTMLGWAFAAALDWPGYANRFGTHLWVNGVTTPLLWYSVLEGGTGGGTYNPGTGEFRGYPAAQDSPYKLPFPKGQSVFVIQANQGLFSHNALNGVNQVYAYDFGLDAGDDILAARRGTVVDFFDWIANDTNPTTDAEKEVARTASAGLVAPDQTNWTSWNFIIIRHDTVLPDYDQDVGGSDTGVTTFAVYGHGRESGVRDAFAERGVTDISTILGATVLQGDKIMKAGHTGLSFHNHLHMEVKVLNTELTPADARGVLHRLKAHSLPFVFREVRHTIGPDGVLKARCWYTSDNEAT
jgi:murein DD-endopeptidase MepM/ murein hydrolase activator NlpD